MRGLYPIVVLEIDSDLIRTRQGYAFRKYTHVASLHEAYRQVGSVQPIEMQPALTFFRGPRSLVLLPTVPRSVRLCFTETCGTSSVTVTHVPPS